MVSTLVLRFVSLDLNAVYLFQWQHKQFETLDVGVQEEFIRYLQERGIDDDLAVFIPELIEHKEQKVCRSLLRQRYFSPCATGIRQVAWKGQRICRRVRTPAWSCLGVYNTHLLTSSAYLKVSYMFRRIIH